MHMTITAPNDGTEDLDGMTLADLETACRRIRLNGGQDGDRLDVRTNRHHRVRTVSAEVDEARPVKLSPQTGQMVGVHGTSELAVHGEGVVTCDGRYLRVIYANPAEVADRGAGDEPDTVAVQ